MDLVQSFVELPDPLKVRLTAAVVAVIAWAFVRLVQFIPVLRFLENYRLPLSLAAAAELIVIIQNAVPDAFAAVAVAAIQLGLELLALVLVFAQLKKQGVKLFQ